MENECEALPGVAYPGVRDNRSTINTKTGYDEGRLAIWLDDGGYKLQKATRQLHVVYLHKLRSSKKIFYC